MPSSTTSFRAPCAADPGIAVRLVLLVLRAYQLAVSPLIGAHCRFAPSCSAYMAIAIERYGLVAGTGRGLRRLSRCHPWNAGGFDPVD